MSEEVQHEGKLRKYLLGELEEAEQQALEERLLTDDELFDLLHVAEDELVDDYVSGALSAEEREGFDTIFLAAPERRRKLSFAMALRRYVTTGTAAAEAPTAEPASRISAQSSRVIAHPSSWWKQAFSNPYLRLAAAAVIVLGVGLGIWRAFIHEPRVSKGMAALIEAYPDQRPTEARITEWPYAPPPPVTRGSQQGEFDYVGRDRAKALIHEEVAAQQDARAYHDLGRLYLAEHEFEKAIDQFEKALKLDEKNARLHSDYGAALLEKVSADKSKDSSRNDLEAYAKSLEHLNRGLELDASLLEVLFNRALLYEYMSLPQQAEHDWKKYLEKDPKSQWSDEARRHLKKVEDKKVTRSTASAEPLSEFIAAYQSRSDDKAYELISKNTEAITGQLIWCQLVGAHLDSSLKGESDTATVYLQALSYAGKLQEQKAGDRFVSDLAQFYGSLNLEHHAALAQGHALITHAQALLARSETDGAVKSYQKAKAIFDKAHSQLESWFAGYYLGYCLYRKSEFKNSLSALSEVAVYSRAKSYLWLLQSSLTMIANIHAESNQFSSSLACYNESLELSTKLNDAYNTQKNLTSLAHVFKNLGNRKESLAYMQRGLELAADCWPGARQMYRNLDTAAGVLNSFDYHAAAAEYEKAALQEALEARDPAFEHLAYMHLGAIYLKLQNYPEALKCAQRSYEVAKAIAGERTSLRPIAHSSLQLAHTYRQAQDYDKADAFYDDAIKLYKDIDLFAFLYEAHKGRLLCHIARGNDPLAEEELQTVLGFFEEHRSKIKEEKNRNSFFDLEQYIYDIAIDFEYSKQHDSLKAFEYTEKSRARSLLDLMSAGAEAVGKDGPNPIAPSVSRPLMLECIRERMPEQTQILEYSVLEDKVLIWVISRTQFEVAEEKITSRSLTEKALNYWKSISVLAKNGTEETHQQAGELYDILIKPVESLLKKDKYICVVPDKALNYLPFNALVFPATRQYLISEYLLTFAPSANIFLRSSEEALKRSAGKDERVLSVGDPRFNRNVFPDLSSLPSSGKEAEAVYRCYKSGCCLVGKTARKATVSSEMVKADVIHIASHYIIDDRNPMLSKLLLSSDEHAVSKDESADDVLKAYEICQKKLPVTRMVALSACRTGIEHYYKGEGMIGMSRTFLVAGVPLVAASLWPVASDPTADLMISFHEKREPGVRTSAEALRQAQLNMIGDSTGPYSQPYFWAPFIMIGGCASF